MDELTEKEKEIIINKAIRKKVEAIKFGVKNLL